MTQKKVATKAERQRHSAEFTQQALLRAVKNGVPMAAQDLGLEAAQLYAWQWKAGQQGQDAEAQRLMQSEQARLKREVACLEDEVAFLNEAAAYFAKQPK